MRQSAIGEPTQRTAAAPQLARKHRPAVLVTGMHRSGTSIVALGLNSLGVPLGSDLLTATEHNPAGYGEDVEFLEFHRRLFASMWSDDGACGPGHHHDWGYDPEESFDPRVFDSFEAEVDQLVDRPGTGPWAFKDPRTTLVLDQWLRRLADPRVLLVVRSPDEVARSMSGLGQQDWHDPVLAHRIWRFYNRRVLTFARHAQVPYAVVHGSITHAGPRVLAGVLRDHLGVDLPTNAVSFGHLDTHRFDTSPVRHRLPPRERVASDLLWWRLRRESAWMP